MTTDTEVMSRAAYLRSAMISDLKEHGDIEMGDTGGAYIEWRRRMQRNGVDSTDSEFRSRVGDLKKRGVIETDTAGTHSYAVRLLDPNIDVEDLPAKSPAPAPVRGGAPRLDKLIADIQRLPVPEQLMVIGKISDDLAAELDELFGRLKGLVG